MTTVEKIKKFQDAAGIDAAGLALIDHADLMGIINPKRMNEPVVLEGPSVPIDRAAVGWQIKASELKGIEVTENGKVVFRGTGHEYGGGQEFDESDREAMRMFDISESDYRKHKDTETGIEEPPLIFGEPEQTDKEKVDQALGLTAEDYRLYG